MKNLFLVNSYLDYRFHQMTIIENLLMELQINRRKGYDYSIFKRKLSKNQMIYLPERTGSAL